MPQLPERVATRLAALALPLLAAACAAPAAPPAGTVPPAATAVPATAAATQVSATLPPAVEYDLGETTILQARFPEDSRFRHMPVRLNGVIALPAGEGPHPVVLLLHGNHAGCPVPPGDHVDRWPCAPDVEQPNYRGLGQLASQLAAAGYVALSININAENTFGFGEVPSGERLQQLVDKHLTALAEASAGGANDFGVDLKGRADLRQLALMGHSRGGEAAYWLADQSPLTSGAEAAFGPAAGVLMIAPAAMFVDASAGARVPTATVLPACDGDLFTQEGKHFYEMARLAPEQAEWATSVWLEQANHNFFNTLLRDDAVVLGNRPDCQDRLSGEAQRDFLGAYATDFLTTVFGRDPAAIAAAAARLGLDARAPAPDTLYGLPARVTVMPAAGDRRVLMIPATADELTKNLAGGSVTADGVTTFFCEMGYYTPTVKPGSEPCQRVNTSIPGDPAMVVVTWPQQGAALRFALPAGEGDLSGYTTLALRAAVDPLSPLNAQGRRQAFSLRLTDGAGQSATVSTRPDEPALGFPAGTVVDNDPFEGGRFTGRAPMTTIRLPLSEFHGVDLSDIREVALVFDQTASGALFLGDLEWQRPAAGSAE